MIRTIIASFFLTLILLLAMPVRPVSAVLDVGDSVEKGIQCGQIGLSCCAESGDFSDFNIPLEGVPYVGVLLRVIPIDQALDFIIGKLGVGLTQFVNTHLVENIFHVGEDQKQCPSGGKAQGSGESCVCVDDRVENLTRLCQGIKSPGEIQQCVRCNTNGRGIWTGLGCFETDISALIKNTLLGLGVALGGVVSMLCIIYSSVMLQTSGGNPERIKKAREYLTSCIIGLLLILFSVFLLQLIGVNILRLPGFS